MIRENTALNKEMRISRYTIDPIKQHDKSLIDIIIIKYNKFVIKARGFMSKIPLFNNISKRYEKYILYGDSNRIKAIDFITNKLVISLIFVFITIFSFVLQRRNITFLGILINFIIGYYLFDIYLIIKNKRRVKLIKNQMLRAIIIMNNAFKSGKSTIQAVEIASLELSEPLNLEFQKIYLDMKYGLSVDTVFERFAKRIDIEEARYISSSLTILNKTGGNIVNVFSSIEKTLFDKQKLKEELKNLTVSSNMVVKILLVVPVVFVGIIYILNPNYFTPLFNSVVGYMIIGLIILMFILYAWLLQKIMKVEV